MTQRSPANLQGQRIWRAAWIGHPQGAALEVDATALPALEDLQSLGPALRPGRSVRRTPGEAGSSKINIGRNERDPTSLELPGADALPDIKTNYQLRCPEQHGLDRPRTNDEALSEFYLCSGLPRNTRYIGRTVWFCGSSERGSGVAPEAGGAMPAPRGIEDPGKAKPSNPFRGAGWPERAPSYASASSRYPSAATVSQRSRNFGWPPL